MQFIEELKKFYKNTIFTKNSAAYSTAKDLIDKKIHPKLINKAKRGEKICYYSYTDAELFLKDKTPESIILDDDYLFTVFSYLEKILTEEGFEVQVLEYVGLIIKGWAED